METMTPMSEELKRAREYEEVFGKRISDAERPAFHLSPYTGWMNDPNGFSFYQGKYHMFYQYYPYDSHWGPMHWGHAVSDDLLHWEHLPAALAPDRPYDHDGCFSGSAVTTPDGRQMLMYTGVRKEVQPDGSIRDVQTQNLAFGDGIDYEKFDGNPVLTEKDLPEGGSRFDFRDPKMWFCGDGCWRMVAVNDHFGEGGEVLLFESRDLQHWASLGPLITNHNRIGLMWECPDLFSLDGYDVLLASAQDMLPKDFEYHNGNGTFYLLGHWDQAEGRFCAEADHAADYGIDFYAPQTILTPDGRRVMIGWMQNWDTCNLHTSSVPWFGQMSLPRELSIRNGILYQQPIRELEQLRKRNVVYRNVHLKDGEIQLDGIQGRTLDMTIELEPDTESPLYHRFAVRFAKNDQYQTTVSFRPHESILKIDRKFSGSRRAVIHQRRAKVHHEEGSLKLRLILDRFSCEVFVNDGEQVLSMTVSTDPCAQEVSFFAAGAMHFHVNTYELEN